ncbi:MAG: RES family NAD+ phosphorylase [Acidimicrobiia bacterium]|nr:RES family NAD+ phosphorylase [Acidimicrobiia bacterium]
MSPNQPPPPQFRGAPQRHLLQEGTTLARIHSASFGAVEFNPTVATHDLAGGRFDSTPSDEYAYLYAAEDDTTAVSEVLLRDLPIDNHGARMLPESQLEQLRIARLKATCDLPLVSLRSGRDLAAVGQDSWLTSAPSSEYSMTRRWASAIRSWAPWACGLTWRSHREPDGYAYVLFDDRCPSRCFEDDEDSLPLLLDSRNISTGTARLYIEEILTSYRVVLTP